MSVTLSSLAGAGAQFFDNNGVPLAGGLIYTYLAGTTTPATTYTSSTGLTAHANPIVLDSAGRIATGEVWLTSGVDYKFLVKTSANVQLGSYDNIPSINDFTSIYAALANTSNVALGDALVGFRQSNSAGNLSGAVGRTVHQKLQETISVKDFGAVGDGVTNDTSAINAGRVATSSGGSLLFPKGQYLYNSVVANIPFDFIWNNNGFTGGINLLQYPSSVQYLFTAETPNTTPQNQADSRVPLAITTVARGAQHGDCVRGNLLNYSVDGQGNTCFYANAQSGATGGWSAGHHAETYAGNGTNITFNAEAASYSATCGIFGAVFSNVTATRIGTTHPLTGAAPIAPTNNTANVGILIIGTADINEMGGWGTGIHFQNWSLKTGAIGIRFNTVKVVEAFFSTGVETASSISDIILRGNSSNGIILLGNYTNAAMRIESGEFISLEGTGSQKILCGNNSPEGVVTASIGSLFCRLDGGPGTALYVKESGSGNIGWAGK